MGQDHDTNHKCVRFIKKVTSNKSFWSSENRSITRVLLILIQLWNSTPEQVLDGQQVPQLSGSLLSTEKAAVLFTGSKNYSGFYPRTRI